MSEPLDPVVFRPSILAMPLMAQFSEELREKLVDIFLDVSDLRREPQGTRWMLEGKHTENKGYVLLRGKVSVAKSGHPEVRRRAPELLGEIIQFNPTGQRTATVTALKDCIVLRFLWDGFWSATEEQLPAGEAEAVKMAIQNHAWDHFNQFM